MNNVMAAEELGRIAVFTSIDTYAETSINSTDVTSGTTFLQQHMLATNTSLSVGGKNN